MQGSSSDCYSTREEYCEATHYYFNGDERDWIDHTWESELYRIDFVLKNKQKKLAIEIDGAEFHQYEEPEKIRDKELTGYGYEVIHFPASYTINGIHKIKDVILERFSILDVN